MSKAPTELYTLLSTSLFPSLRALSCNNFSVVEAEFVLKTVGETLTYVAIPITPPSLDILASRTFTAELTCLRLEGLPANSQVHHHLADLAPVMHAIVKKGVHLRRLEVQMNDTATIWPAACQLPLLELDVDLTPVSRPFDFPATNAKPVLSTLLTLRIRASAFEDVIALLQNASYPRLAHLNIFFFSSIQPSHFVVASLFSAIAASCSLTTLKNIELVCENDIDRTEGPIGSDAFQPLLRFGQLERLWLALGWTWDMNDVLIRDMARAWPRMKTLQLDPANWCSPEGNWITLQGLEPLATHCPELVLFGATIDARTVPPMDPTPTLTPVSPRRASPSMLRNLYLGDSKINDAPQVAAYLSRLFPKIESIAAYQKHLLFGDLAEVELDDEEYERAQGRQRWSEVVALVPLMADVREEERMILSSSASHDADLGN